MMPVRNILVLNTSVSKILVNNISVRHIRIKNYPYKRNRGLSEILAKREFNRRKYMFWRGSFFGADLIKENEFNYSKLIKSHYNLLECLIIEKCGLLKYIQFRNYTSINRGEPDYIVHDKINNKIFFAEIKFKNESIKKHQLRTMREIIRLLKIPVEIWRFTDQRSRVREEVIYTPNELPKDLRHHKAVLKRERKLTCFIK